MTSTKDKIKVMQAFLNGSYIEYLYKETTGRGWEPWADGVEPIWNWADMDYRIKGEIIHPTRIEIKPDVKTMIDEILDENIALKHRVEFLENLRQEDQEAFKRAEERRIEDEQIIMQQGQNLNKSNKAVMVLKKDFDIVRAELTERIYWINRLQTELAQYKNNEAVMNMQKELQLKQQKIVDLKGSNNTMAECLNQLQEIAKRFGMGE